MEYHDCDVCNNRITSTLRQTTVAVYELNDTNASNEDIDLCDDCAHPFNADEIAIVARDAVIAHLRKR